MSAWLPEVLAWVHTYGYFAVWGALFIAAVGLPLPGNLILLAVGALSAVGHFNIILLVLVATSGAICGDQIGYLFGRWWGRRLLRWLERSPRWQLPAERVIVPAEAYFTRHGGWAIFLSRFLVTSLGGEINLLAGADAYPYHRFFLADAAGEALGAIIPLSLGYISGAKWGAVGNEFGTISLIVLVAGIFLSLSLVLGRTRWQTRHPQRRIGEDSPSSRGNQQQTSHLPAMVESAPDDQQPGTSVQVKVPKA